MSQLPLFLLWSIRIASAIILFLPLVVTTSTYFPFVMGKIIFFQMIVEISLVFWVALMILEPRYRPNFHHPLTRALGIFLGALCITSLFGVQLGHSFWSNQERMAGLVTLLHYYAWYLMLVSTHRDWRDWRRLFLVSFIVSFLVGFSAIAQVMTQNIDRAYATVGNPLYLGSYALVHIFLGIYLFIREKGIQIRVFTAFLVLYTIGILALTGSRTVALVMIFSFFLLGLCAVFLLRNLRLKLAALAGVVFFALFMGCSYWYLTTEQGTAWGTAHLGAGVMRVVQHTFVADDRLLLWQIALRGLSERPLTGWGWENYNLVFNKYFDHNSMYYALPVQWYDRAHSQLMDVIALSGIVGLCAYIFFWATLCGVLFRLVRRETTFRQQFLALIVGIILLGYFLQNLTGFDTPITLTLFYLLIAFAYFLTSTPTDDAPDARQPQQVKRALSIILPLTAVSMGGIMYFANVIPLTSSILSMEARRVIAQNPQKGLELYKRSLEHPSFTNYEARNFLAQDVVFQLLPLGLSPDAMKHALYFAREESEKNVAEHPLDQKSYMAFAGVTRALARFDPSFIEPAIEKMQILYGLSPNRPEIYQEIAELYAAKKDFVHAREVYERMVKIFPARGEPYLLAARMALQEQNPVLAMQMVDQARIHNYAVFSDTRFWYDAVLTLPKNTPQPAVAEKIAEGQKLHPKVKEYLIVAIVFADREGDQKRKNTLLANYRKDYALTARELEKYLREAHVAFTPLPAGTVPIETKKSAP